MKKIFTLLAAATAALAMSAADFTLYFGDTPITADKEITTGFTTYGAPDVDGDDVYQFYSQQAHLYVQGEEGIEVTVEVTAAETMPTFKLQFCWPTNCQMVNPGTPAISTSALTGEKEDLEIHGPLEEGVNGEIPTFECPMEFTVKVYETAVPEEAITVKMTITTEYGATGIKATAANGNYVKALNGNVLAYNVDTPSTLSVYAITGKLAAKYNIANAGTLNVSNLSKGVYVYTTGRLSGKFIVR